MRNRNTGAVAEIAPVAADEAAAVYVAIETLLPWVKNPRKNDMAVAEVAKSIERFGFGSPLLARKANGEVIAGHTRIKAALQLGIETVPVRYLDLSEKEAHLLALADNKLGELADWNEEMLAEIAAEYDKADLNTAGFSDDEIAELLKPDVAAGLDDADLELPEEPVSAPGEVYELGPHRLVCGDARDAAAWVSLFPGDERAQVCWTDPPYGVSYVGKTKDALTIDNDDITAEQLRELLNDTFAMLLAHSEPGAPWYVSGPPGPLGSVFVAALSAIDVLHQILIWEKNQFVMGRSDYHYRHEPIFYGWAPGAAHYWCGDRDIDTILKFDRPQRSADHPTMKPTELVQACLRNSSKTGWLVVDPFAGSGTTLIAAALEGRRARLIEFGPNYCDVIRRRWGAFARSAGVDPGPGAL